MIIEMRLILLQKLNSPSIVATLSSIVVALVERLVVGIVMLSAVVNLQVLMDEL